VINFNKDFIQRWTGHRAARAHRGVKQLEAARLVADILTAARQHGLRREDLEETLGADLDFYMQQALAKAMMHQDGRNQKRTIRGMYEHYGREPRIADPRLHDQGAHRKDEEVAPL